jgi:hypothetical protein
VQEIIFAKEMTSQPIENSDRQRQDHLALLADFRVHNRGMARQNVSRGKNSSMSGEILVCQTK